LTSPWALARNLKWWLTPRCSDLDVVFVVGAPRSGTTLLQRTLVGHSDFFSIPGESGIFTRQDVFDPRRKHFGLELEARKELLLTSASNVEFFERAVRSLPSALPGKVFVEKTPQHAFRTRFLLNRFPRSRIVNLVRDGRDCYCSSQANPRIPQRHSVGAFARYWRNCVRSVDQQALPGRVFEMRYEDFVAQPRVWLERMMAFLGHAAEARQLDPVETGNDPRSRLQEFQRLGTEIDSGSVGRWRSKLSPEEQEIFKRVAGEELSRKGYES